MHACRCWAAGIPVAQLHGDRARAGLQEVQQAGLQVIYVLNATPDGQVQTAAPSVQPDWLLIDGMQVRTDHSLATCRLALGSEMGRALAGLQQQCLCNCARIHMHEESMYWVATLP